MVQDCIVRIHCLVLLLNQKQRNQSKFFTEFKISANPFHRVRSYWVWIVVEIHTAIFQAWNIMEQKNSDKSINQA
jgi:hypothetical protein